MQSHYHKMCSQLQKGAERILSFSMLVLDCILDNNYFCPILQLTWFQTIVRKLSTSNFRLCKLECALIIMNMVYIRLSVSADNATISKTNPDRSGAWMPLRLGYWVIYRYAKPVSVLAEFHRYANTGVYLSQLPWHVTLDWVTDRKGVHVRLLSLLVYFEPILLQAAQIDSKSRWDS